VNSNRPEFVEQLMALGRHLTEHPGLPEIYHVRDGLDGFNVRLYSNDDERKLTAWAVTLQGPVTSFAERCTNHVDGHIRGQLGGYPFEVVASIPSDAVPTKLGRHEWTVPAGDRTVGA
jgi:hypothetical protein